jgi:hypothetical protein
MLSEEEIRKRCAERGVEIELTEKRNCYYSHLKKICWSGKRLSSLNHEFEHSLAKNFLENLWIEIKSFNISPIPINYDEKERKVYLSANFIAFMFYIMLMCVTLYAVLFLKVLLL